ncbi:hypothetical protein LOTGIDRAFT_222060 [Lottia gigantea]|uniref:Gfo/Idh/MocA-like oxidoreductase N-terminal domain-containing protein n=1 Tax=Lottia gigantea TaxID=225164 RepID=V3Z1X8_LOTGI|nr:hypothetical protein LOTGIDRAFT_222060 [Lottia gigantea]ESO84558.1 hypothetical protein LOTGIDRAFT_222060 [Lottia gigantea]
MEPTRKNRIGIALFGCGRIGSLHLRNLATLPTEILWVVDVKVSHENITDLLDELRLSSTQVADVSEMDKVLLDERVNGIIICTRVDQHERLIIEALNAGKHVFCEKPLALSTQSIITCYQLAQKFHRSLMCGFQRRFDKEFRIVYDELQSKKHGKTQLIKITSRDNPIYHSMEYIKNSGGIFLDACSHDFDMAIWLAGEMPTSIVVYGHALDDAYIECDDVSCTTIMIRFPSGTIATIDNSRHGADYGYDQRIEVLCSRGMIKAENRRENSVEIHNSTGTILSPLVDFFQERYKEAFRHELHHFIKVVQGKESIIIKGEEVVAGSVLIEKAKQSLKSGQNIQLTEQDLGSGLTY